ncbi:LIM homeobox transcription factor 1-beta isoform X1 [Drosophila takahashii]|uniref:LIM homeobox transcription factor 1-beta isoform X1 n=2 Tax=Drosophila takahashii TaxID=29030 RepID=UPI001CF87B12|nr:LIM homeobox transcription factor 1-beta isoform X1 [Drosophila takahashii]
MIDEQHPMQIGLFPMDIKCQQQQQQQQQQTPQTGGLNQLLLNGNERMLTTPTTAATSVVATGSGRSTSAAATSSAKAGVAHNDKMASVGRNVNGSCSSHNSNSINKQPMGGIQMPGPGAGPGPPSHSHPHPHPLCSRITLGECSLNGMDSFATPAAPPSSASNTPQAPQGMGSSSISSSGMAMELSLGMGPQCAHCCQPICDRYIMRVVENSFHEGCLKCTACSLHLVHSCYAREGKLYCRIDYERLYIRNHCLGCGLKIGADELVMRCHENVFHLKCFACVVCGALLKKGEQYVVKQGQLFCRFDYEKEVEMLQGYDFYGDELFPPKLDGRRGPKRPRTILNTQQRRAFKASFEVSPKPCRKVRENLAKDTGLSLRIVQVWFQNQRAKVKKIQKKAKQEPPSKGASDSQDSQESLDSSLATKIKDEAHSDSESQLESPYSTTSDGLNRMRCTIKDEQEQVPFNCMETNKENCNKNSEPILNTILGLSYATFQQLMGPFAQTPMINPIDRLYSMQSSYFRPEELQAYGECGVKDSLDH